MLEIMVWASGGRRCWRAAGQSGVVVQSILSVDKYFLGYHGGEIFFHKVRIFSSSTGAGLLIHNCGLWDRKLNSDSSLQSSMPFSITSPAQGSLYQKQLGDPNTSSSSSSNDISYSSRSSGSNGSDSVIKSDLVSGHYPVMSGCRYEDQQWIY